MSRARRAAALVGAALLLSPLARPGEPAPPGGGSATPGAATAAPPSRARHPRELRFQPLRYRPPEPRTQALANGLRLCLLEDRPLPLVEGLLQIEVGGIDDPPDAVGLAEVVGDLLRSGGTHTRPAEEVDEEIDALGAEVEVSVAEELTAIRFSALSRDLDRILALVSDLVRNPAFREDRLDLKRAQMGEEVRRLWDQPRTIAALRLADLVYGSSSRWARRPSEPSLAQIGQSACRAFHAAHFTPGRTWLGLAGDLDAGATRRKVQELFGHWRGQRRAARPHEAVAGGTPPGVYWIERDLPQAQVGVGHLGAARLGPDHYALKLLNLIVGQGGGTSRLYREVRTARGLAYSVGGGVGESYDRGIFRVDLQTRPERAAEALAAVREVLLGARERLPAEEEMRVAREREANSFVFHFASPFAIVRERLLHGALGYPADYLATYLERILAVGPEDVRRSARAYVRPEDLLTLIVGPEASAAPLREAGMEVRRIPLDPKSGS